MDDDKGIKHEFLNHMGGLRQEAREFQRPESEQFHDRVWTLCWRSLSTLRILWERCAIS
jgi:hypothetical protein